MKLSGKVAIITGSGSGLRKAMAIHMAREGAAVMVNDINLENMQNVVSEIKNAGITRHRRFLDITEEGWDAVLAVDLKSVFNCIQAAAGYMLQHRYGKIINISSVAGTGVTPHNGGTANYAAAKAGGCKTKGLEAGVAGEELLGKRANLFGLVMS
ncbi:SDR family NAD(P)-dependent oxidoreductase [Chloroflexota bacterium]